MKKETTIQQENICNHCGEKYTVGERNRVYGSNPLMQGYCSAGCYTNGVLMKPLEIAVDWLGIPKEGDIHYKFDTLKKEAAKIKIENDRLKTALRKIESLCDMANEHKVYGEDIILQISATAVCI